MSASPPTIGRGRRILFTAITVALSLVLLEVGIRAVFAVKMGPRVFLYGTDHFRNTPSLAPAPAGIQLPGAAGAHRKGDHPAVGNTDLAVGTDAGGYAKYFPNQPKIDYDEHGNKFQVTINEHGFRGRSFDVERQPGVVRVVTLGASSTFGYYNRDTETYPYLLEQALNRGGGTRFEVLNFGIPHLTSAQILALFQREVLPLRPDVVTFYEGINDSSQMPEQAWQAKRKEAADDTLPGSLRRSLAGLALVREMYIGARDRLMALALVDSLLRSDVIAYDRVDVEKHIQGKSAQFLANLSALREACRERKIVLIVMTQQARSMAVGTVKGVTYDDEHRAIQGRLTARNAVSHQEKAFLAHKVVMDNLRAWARSERVPLLDVIELLDQDRDVLLSWVHLNPRGNRMIADALAQRILEVRSKADF